MTEYTFKPSDDITTKELAMITKVFVVSILEAMQGKLPTGVDNLDVEEHIYNKMPEEIKKHFVQKSVTYQVESDNQK